MATLAALLDVRLEKPGAYVLAPSEDRPTVAEANAAITVVDRAALLATLAACSAVALAPGRREDQSTSSPVSRWSASVRFLRRWLPWS
jgi:hypothetical protein